MSWYLVKNYFDYSKVTMNDEWKMHYTPNGYSIGYKFEQRFSQDKVISTKDDIFLLDGILINKNELLETEESLDQWIEERSNGGEITYFQEFRGAFSGFHIQKNNEKTIIYGNQTGDAPVFYIYQNGLFCAASEMHTLVMLCENLGIELHLNELAANHLLSLGYIVENNTIAKEIKKLEPGEYLLVDGEEISVKRYHLFSNKQKISVSMDEAIELLDKAFMKAVRRGLDKDIEGGFENHLINLSAGLDCKMISFAAKRMGYKNITNNTYAKYGSDEIDYVMKAAQYLRNDLIFMPLDSMSYIYDIEQLIIKNHGLSIFAGSTGCNRMLSNINFNKFGLEHNGMLGDVVIGSFFKAPNCSRVPDVSAITYTDKIKPILHNVDSWENHELFALYYRGFQGAVTSHFIRNTHTISYSPFLDVDFMQFCLELPIEYRCGHKLYWKWIYKKYPEIVDLPTTTYNPYKKEISKRKLSRLIPDRFRKEIISWLQKSGLIDVIIGTNTMKPQDEMIKNNPDVSAFMDKYFSDNYSLFSSYPEIQRELQLLMNGNVIEKELALTIVGAVKVFELK
jgi:asparagine synthase (glutamine-hydrolysing)